MRLTTVEFPRAVLVPGSNPQELTQQFREVDGFELVRDGDWITIRKGDRAIDVHTSGTWVERAVLVPTTPDEVVEATIGAALLADENGPASSEIAVIPKMCLYCGKICADARGLSAHVRAKHAEERQV